MGTWGKKYVLGWIFEMSFKLLFIFLIGRYLKELECRQGRGQKGARRVPGTWHILRKQVEDRVFVLPRLTREV